MQQTILRKDIIKEIELPKSLFVWILKNVDCPIIGFEHKRTGSGEFISLKEQISETQYQLFLIASDYYKKGVSPKRIQEILTQFLHEEC